MLIELNVLLNLNHMETDATLPMLTIERHFKIDL